MPISLFKGREIGALTGRNSYTRTGFGFLLGGLLIATTAYFIFELIWLTALGICMLVMASILIALGNSVPRLPPEVCSLLLKTGNENIGSLIEELGIKSKAIYLPSSLASDCPRAFLPLHSNGSRPRITRALPRRLFARYGSGPEDIGLLISTVGSTAVTMLETRPGASPAELESALTSLFTGRLGVADSARVICFNGTIRVEIDKPRLETGTSCSHQCLGGPLADMVASIAAEAWDKPMTITREEQNKGKYCIELEVGK